ncbi:tetratricopeptide repeat protein [Muricauda sp. SYSU M86414]|nr:tetratricopeptide repeat protein [Muricauda sp. SYSU M86414]
MSICLMFFLTAFQLWPQNALLNSEKAFTEFQKISDSIAVDFPEDDIKTYRRSSFSESQLQNYLSLHYKRLDLLKYIDGHHSFVLDSYLHSGNWFMEVGFPKESIKSYLNFFKHYRAQEGNLTEKERDVYIEMLTYARSILAQNYAELNELDSAAIQHKKNLEYTKSLDFIYYPSALNNYGLFFYWHKKDLDSAMHYFQKAYTITKASYPNHTLIGSIRDNIADIHTELGDYLKAQPLYATNFEFFKTAINEKTHTKDIPRLISAGAQLTITNAYLNRLAAAQRTFKELEAIVVSHEEKNSLDSNSKLEYLEAKEFLLKQQNKIPEAYATSQQINAYADSLQLIAKIADEKWQTELNDAIVDRIAINFKIDRIQKENKIKSQRTRLWFSGVLSSVFIILLIVLYLNRRQHLVNAKNKQLLTEQKFENTALKVEQLNTEIKSRERDLSDFAIRLTQDQDWAKALANQLSSIKQADGKEREALIEELDHTIANKISVDTDTREFFDRLDKLSNTFYSKLTQNYPDLSKNEIRLCSLIRLKIESRSIASLQNITLASLNTSRYRLRKKLNLSENTDLDLFIQGL